MCFDSILVRLKASVPIVVGMTSLKFRFHTGSIKRRAISVVALGV